jgi:hypothetical protein
VSLLLFGARVGTQQCYLKPDMWSGHSCPLPLLLFLFLALVILLVLVPDPNWLRNTNTNFKSKGSGQECPLHNSQASLPRPQPLRYSFIHVY